MIKHLKQTENIEVKVLRCDNAGENKATETMCIAEGLGIKYEYTAPDTPQHTGRVESKLATLYGRMRSMMNAANLDGFYARAYGLNAGMPQPGMKT
jgi:hypothetical protein